MNPLAPLGIVYGAVMDVRNRLYDRGILRSSSLGARTISIGNVTAGGTGKTPLVALTARMLADAGAKVCVLTRGYGRANERERVLVSDGENVLADAAVGGDEPVELARKLLGRAVVVADADRVRAARWAGEKFGITAFVLDDAFQHRRAKRDLDIVCVDATQPLEGVLPAGRLRESPRGLRRANVIVITRADMAADIDELRTRISSLAPGTPVFLAETAVSAVVPLIEYRAAAALADGSGPAKPWEHLIKANNNNGGVLLAAFCALGNPENFFGLLDREFENLSVNGLEIADTKAFPDHHFYGQQDVDRLERLAREGRIDAFVTTAKDAVKLAELKFAVPCYVVETEPRLDAMEEFRRLVVSG